MDYNGSEFYTIVAIVVIVILAFFVTAGRLVDESVAVEALQKQGFTDVHITKKDWFLVGFKGCGEDDDVKFTATANNPRNETVEVYVCSGWLFKGSTVRS